MTPATTYTQATTADIPLLISLRIEFLTGLFGEQQPADIAALSVQLSAYFHQAIPAGTCHCIIARRQGEIAGTGCIVVRSELGNFKPHGWKTAYIRNMYTLPQFRKQGIGKEILHRLVTLAREQGAGNIELHATEDGEPLYRDYGFAEPHSRFMELSAD